MTSDKRHVKRISVELAVTVYLFDSRRKARMGGAMAGSIRNFSPVGAALTVATIMLDGKHLFYSCHDNPDIQLQLEFEFNEDPEKSLFVPAAPVWFDRDLESDKKQFVVGVKFLVGAKSHEIKKLSRQACKDETRLFSLWKKLF